MGEMMKNQTNSAALVRVAIYTRYSTTQQDGDSIERQLEVCRERVAREPGWTVVGVYSDPEVSGGTYINQRPEGARLLRDAEARCFDVILVEDSSRLSRSVPDLTMTLHRLRAWRVALVAAKGTTDTRQRANRMMVNVEAAFNEQYREIISIKTHDALRMKAAKGEPTGGRSYGYGVHRAYDPTRRDRHGKPVLLEHRLVVNEAEAAVVRRIFTLYADGHAPKTICELLDKDGVPSPGSSWNRTNPNRAGGWQPSAIHGDARLGTGILNNPLYVGQQIWNRREWQEKPIIRGGEVTITHVPVERPRDEWIVRDVPELRIVDDALWERVKARQRERAQSRGAAVKAGLSKATGGRGRYPSYLFSSLLKCGLCGANFIMANGSTYACARSWKRVGEHRCSNRLRVPRRDVERALLGHIRDDLLAPEALAAFTKEYARLQRERQSGGGAERARLTAELRRVEERIGNLMRAIEAGIITPSTKAQLLGAEAEKERLTSALAAASAAPADNVATLLPRAAERYRALVDDLPLSTQREVYLARQNVQRLVGEVRLVPAGNALIAELWGDLSGLLALPAAEGRQREGKRGCGGRI